MFLLIGKINKVESTESKMKEREMGESTQDQKLLSEFRDQEKHNGNSTRIKSLDKSMVQRRNISCEGSLATTDAESGNNFKVTNDSDIQTDSICKRPRDCLNKITQFHDTDVSRRSKHEYIGSSLNVKTLGDQHEYLNDLSTKEKHDSFERKLKVSNKEVTSYSPNDIMDSNHGCIKKSMDNNSFNKILQKADDSECNLGNALKRSWQWLDSSGVWVDYPDYVNNQINHRLQQHPKASVLVKFKEKR